MFSRFRRVAGACGAAGILVISLTGAPAAAGPIRGPVSPNLLVNPGAEAGDPSLSGYRSVSVPGWTAAGRPTVVRYGTVAKSPSSSPLSVPRPPFPTMLQFPRPGDGPPDGGGRFFSGGSVATATLSQTVDLSGTAAQIDTGTLPYTLSGWLGGFLEDLSEASVTVNLLAANGSQLGAGQIGPVGVLQRRLKTALFQRVTAGTVPVGSRSAVVVAAFKDCNPSPSHGRKGMRYVSA